MLWLPPLGFFNCCCGATPGQLCAACLDNDAPDYITVTISNWTSVGCSLNGSWVVPYDACIGAENTPTGKSCGGNPAYGVCALYFDTIALGGGCPNWFASVEVCKDAMIPTSAKMQIQGDWLTGLGSFLRFCYRDPSDRDCRNKTGLVATILGFAGSSTTPTVTIDMP